MVTAPLPLTSLSNKVANMHLATSRLESRIYYYRNNKKQIDLHTSQSACTFCVSAASWPFQDLGWSYPQL